MSDEPAIRLMVVDDEPGVRHLCSTIALGIGLDCSYAENTWDALDQATKNTPELIFAGLSGGNDAVLELLAELKRLSPHAEVALMISDATEQHVLQAMRLGAYGFVIKPLRGEEFKLVLERMVERVQLVRENESLRRQLQNGVQVGTQVQFCSDLEELERLTVQRVFELVDGDKEQAQKLLGISRATLYRKIKRYGIRTRQECSKDRELESRESGRRMILLSQR